ncbi:hypothetical protein ElyMa_004201200 [Elysia marginata]|uniref:Uncharacterized protein n=1 Tax=Elysia marginata TaxID=1093978 RepID=A0AAV4GMH7_9GAST|nr:hypothetical protein ElyMa_004201200 [Elysia marginata]
MTDKSNPAVKGRPQVGHKLVVEVEAKEGSVFAQPGLCFLLEGRDAGHVGLLKGLRAGDFNLSPDAEESAEATCVKMVEPSGVAAVDRPRLKVHSLA